LKVYEHRVLIRIFGSEREGKYEVAGYNRVLRSVIIYIHQIALDGPTQGDLKRKGRIPYMGQMRIIVIEPGRKRPVGRSKCLWEDYFEMDLDLMGHGEVDRFCVAVEWDQQWRCVENTVGSRRVPQKTGNVDISPTLLRAVNSVHLFISVKQSISANNVYVFSRLTVCKLQGFSREAVHFPVASK
jgi:hypothetical protein